MTASHTNTTALFSRSTEIANTVTHSAFDFFERPSVLIIYKGSFDRERFPHVGCRGPQLDFFCNRGKSELFRLQSHCLAVEVCLYQPYGTEKVKPAGVELTFANNTLHSLFSHVQIFLSGKLNSSSNNNSPLSVHRNRIDLTLLVNFRERCVKFISTKRTGGQTERKKKELKEIRNGEQFSLELYGAPHINLLDCERLLLPGVTLHLHFYRSANNCAIESVGTWAAADIRRFAQTPYVVVIERTSVFVNKVVLSDAVKVSIERALTKSPAVYPYNE